MKPLKNDNQIRAMAIVAGKEIRDLGSPWGPDESYGVGFKTAQRLYLEAVMELEAEIADLKRKVLKNEL